MIPFLLAALGGYLIGDSMKDSQTNVMANGGAIPDKNILISEIKNDRMWAIKNIDDGELGYRVFDINMYQEQPKMNSGGYGGYGYGSVSDTF